MKDEIWRWDIEQFVNFSDVVKFFDNREPSNDDDEKRTEALSTLKYKVKRLFEYEKSRCRNSSNENAPLVNHVNAFITAETKGVFRGDMVGYAVRGSLENVMCELRVKYNSMESVVLAEILISLANKCANKRRV